MELPNKIFARYETNRSGPKTLLWGTPETTSTRTLDSAIHHSAVVADRPTMVDHITKQLVQEPHKINSIKCSIKINLDQPWFTPQHDGPYRMRDSLVFEPATLRTRSDCQTHYTKVALQDHQPGTTMTHRGLHMTRHARPQCMKSRWYPLHNEL